MFCAALGAEIVASAYRYQAILRVQDLLDIRPHMLSIIEKYRSIEHRHKDCSHKHDTISSFLLTTSQLAATLSCPRGRVHMSFVKANQVQSERGTSLISAVIAIGIVTLASTHLFRTTSQSMSSMRFVEQRGDMESIRQMLISGLDCSATFLDNAVNTNVDCSSTSALNGQSSGKFLRLRRATLNGGVHYITGSLETSGNFANAGRFGDWYLRATCSEAEQSLVIRVARGTSTGTFAKDPLTGQVLDWNHPSSLLFGSGSGGTPICFNSSSGGSSSSTTTNTESVTFNGVPKGLSCVRKTVNPIQVYSDSSSVTYFCDGKTTGTGSAATALTNAFILNLNCSSTQGLGENMLSYRAAACTNLTGIPMANHTNPTLDMLCCSFE